MNDSTRIGLRISKRVREDFEKEAEKENRSLSNMVETALREWLKGRGYDY